MTTTDLIARLRYTAEHGTLAAIDAGMDADPALVADALEAMREALSPFANCCEYISDDEDDEEWAKFRLLIKDYRRARAALEEHHD